MKKLDQAVKQYEDISEQFHQLMTRAEIDLANMSGVTLCCDEQGYKLSALGRTIGFRFKMVSRISGGFLGELTAYFVRENLTGRNRDGDIMILHSIWFDKLGNVYTTSYDDSSSHNISMDDGILLSFVQKTLEVFLETTEFYSESGHL